MTSQYRIIIKNMSTATMSFHAFQQQASFTASGTTLTPLSSSLASGPLAPYGSSGTQLDFVFDVQNYVGARSSVTPSPTAMATTTLSLFSTSNTVSEASAVQPIDLATASSSPTVGNASTLTVSPLGLSTPTFQSAVPPGCFGVQIPAYTPGSLPELYCGCATINQDGSVALSSYVRPNPNSQIYCAPVAIYYVATGSYAPGQPIPYNISQSALCDFTSGFPTVNVLYNSDGSFTTKESF